MLKQILTAIRTTTGHYDEMSRDDLIASNEQGDDTIVNLLGVIVLLILYIIFTA